jgi:hypothetical protein
MRDLSSTDFAKANSAQRIDESWNFEILDGNAVLWRKADCFVSCATTTTGHDTAQRTPSSCGAAVPRTSGFRTQKTPDPRILRTCAFEFWTQISPEKKSDPEFKQPTTSSNAYPPTFQNQTSGILSNGNYRR